MVEVFATNVCCPLEAEALIGMLHRVLPGSRINFDLTDCDRVLRIEHTAVPVHEVIRALREKGYECAPLE